MGDLRILGIELPATVKGVTLIDDDDSYCVIVNSILCEAVQKEVILHEMSHISSLHFYDSNPVAEVEIEANAHENMDEITQMLRDYTCTQF